MEGSYEFHWQEEAPGQVTAQLYAVEDGGQYRHVADWRSGPFDTHLDLAAWLRRQVLLDFQVTHVLQG
jgi:hypothetical protein